MAEGGPRSSSRIIKPKVKEGFLYDKESVSFLLRRGSTEERQHHSTDWTATTFLRLQIIMERIERTLCSG